MKRAWTLTGGEHRHTCKAFNDATPTSAHANKEPCCEREATATVMKVRRCILSRGREVALAGSPMLIGWLGSRALLACGGRPASTANLRPHPLPLLPPSSHTQHGLPDARPPAQGPRTSRASLLLFAASRPAGRSSPARRIGPSPGAFLRPPARVPAAQTSRTIELTSLPLFLCDARLSRLQAGLRCLATAVPSAPVQPVTKISTLPTGLVVASVRPRSPRLLLGSSVFHPEAGR